VKSKVEEANEIMEETHNLEEATEFASAEQIVDAEEVRHDPSEKVKLNGPIEFQFNVPIAKYTSETSDILAPKQQLPSKQRMQAL